MNQDKIIIATNNAGKLAEFTEMFAPFGIQVLGLKDLQNVPDIEENGVSFAENATTKATAIAKTTLDIPVIADDSGLMVEALNGEPGIHSARYAGDHDDSANVKKVLRQLGNLPEAERAATFHTTIVAVKPNGKELVASGEVHGFITTAPRGKGGFGYDPIFYAPELGKTFAEATATEKNQVSHRGRALQELMKNFEKWWNED
ncbi:XTP/dITP diphosphatase [Periweissella cryptocerci]|uniref:dITP/XTP pyrophosphatase n=1 Tax=Periweissella cryptocerci TaxID=2506420 RepID=A0A4P6YWE4_9LACO|nr:XTP/dITP diphosphatase [Periweissella cryptocerci]QBO37219.1 XTP/dITP diphosphatase [Periweissella cryptocerci]